MFKKFGSRNSSNVTVTTEEKARKKIYTTIGETTKLNLKPYIQNLSIQEKNELAKKILHMGLLEIRTLHRHNFKEKTIFEKQRQKIKGMSVIDKALWSSMLADAMHNLPLNIVIQSESTVQLDSAIEEALQYFNCYDPSLAEEALSVLSKQ